MSLFGACMMFLWRKTFSEFYSPLSFSASSVSLKQEDVPFWKKKRFWLAVIVASIYCYWAISTGPKVGEWRALTEPQLVSFTKAIGRVVSQRYLLSAVMTSTSTHYDDCRTIRSLYEMYTKQRKTCPKYEEPDFSFLKRDQLGGIKHVIWLYIESARSDIFPFDPNSPWVKEHLRIEDRASNPISPFFTSLVERGLYFENFRTISTYTLKSLIGGLCSVIPLPLNRLPEHEHKAYRKCLPQILAENDWETIYLQPGTMDWEHQREEMYRMGFKSVVGVEEIDRGVFVGKYRSRFQEVNYFGVDDIPMINPLLEWMEENARDGRCSFASMLTNVNHDPYTCPEGWDMKSYIKDDLPAKVNAYINTARYSDNFIQKLVEALHERELMDETLLVIMGDHGMSLGEHQRVGTNEDPAEQMIKVPCLFYSENEGWAERYPPKKIKDEFSSLDVLPTIMDMLRKDGKQVPDYLFQDYYEGSSQVREAQKDPLRITLVNPGAHSQVFHQKHYKAVVKPAEDERIFYDLTKDPSEDDPKVVEELEGTSREWFESTLEFSKIFQEHIIKLWNMNMTLYHEEGAIE